MRLCYYADGDGAVAAGSAKAWLGHDSNNSHKGLEFRTRVKQRMLYVSEHKHELYQSLRHGGTLQA